MPVIQQVITEGNLVFTFKVDALASQYDDWSHYRGQFSTVCGGSKAVDIVYAESSPSRAWLIEVKDYRVHPRTKVIDLADEVAMKVRDTLAGLVSAKCHANDVAEKRLAANLLKCREIRVVLHLELPVRQSRLRPRAIDHSQVLQKLKSLIKAIDPHPAVVDQHTLKPDMTWTVR